MDQVKSPQQTASGTRYVLLDTLRGLTLISMLLFHFIWDLNYIAGFSMPWYHSTGAEIWQQSICRTFILLSGFCWSFGKNPFKRGLMVLGAGGLITLVTTLVFFEGRILFGILTMTGSAMILMIPLDRLLRKIKHTSVLALLTVASVFVFELLYILLESCPPRPRSNLLTAYLGFPPKDFFSADYFPLLPWFFLFMAGYLLHKLIVRLGWLEYSVFKKNLLPPMTFLGRHSLLIYLLHQPVLYGLTLLILFII